MADTLHTAIIKRVLDQDKNVRERGFRSALMRAIPDHDDHAFDFLHLRPDAYLIDPDYATVVAIEVEVTHPISAEKLEFYCELYWILSWHSWDLVLKTINRFGQQSGLVDMADVALAAVVAEARR